MTHLRLAAVAVLAALLIGGCTGAPANTPSPTSVVPSPAVTATPSLSAEDQMLEDSKARVVLLWKTLDGLLVDPGRSINELDPLASGDAPVVAAVPVAERSAEHLTATPWPS